MFGGNLEPGGRFYVDASGRNLALVCAFFSLLIYSVKKFYTFHAFIAIYKDNAAMNYITFNKKLFIPVNFDGSCYSSQIIILLPGQRLGLHAPCCVREYLFPK